MQPWFETSQDGMGNNSDGLHDMQKRLIMQSVPARDVRGNRQWVPLGGGSLLVTYLVITRLDMWSVGDIQV